MSIVRPRHAASLVLVREGPKGREVLMGRRPVRSRFAPDVFVFPGGAVDPADRRARTLSELAADCARRTGASPTMARALALAALRETAEETGLDLTPDLAAMTLLARAITPPSSPVRFHARFFLADAALASGEPAESAELSDLAFRPLRDSLALPVYDVTEIVLRSLADERPRPFRLTYRRQAPVVTPLD